MAPKTNFRSLKLVKLILNIRRIQHNESRDNKCFKRNILKRDFNKFQVNESRGRRSQEAEEGKAKHSLDNFVLCSRLMKVIKEETQ